MSRFIALLAALWCTCFAHAGSLWFADDRGIHRVDTDTNAVTLNISQSDVQALAVDTRDGALWALSSSRLVKYDANGIKLFAIGSGPSGHDFRLDDLLDAKRLALDTSDGSVWAAGRNFAAHLSSSGSLVGLLISFDPILDIALASDDSLWVLGNGTLARYSPQGSRLASANLSGDMNSTQVLALDDANGALWLGGARKLFKVALALPIQTRLTRSTSETIRAIALDPATGNLWVAGTSSLFGYSTAGSVFVTTNLSSRHLGIFQTLEFVAGTQSPWLGSERALSRFTSGGQFAASISADDVNAIGASASGVVTPPAPTITLVSPATGTLTNNAFLPIRVHFDQANTLTATLNGASIASSFVFDAGSGDSVFTPAVRHAEGLNTFSAFVTNATGVNSATVTTQFTVDTIAPNFVNVTPADGSSFTSANIALLGSVDEAAGRVLLESFSGATFTGANPQGPSFSWAIVLRPGPNSFRLTASDPAGNSRQLSLTYNFSTLALTITSPANGATIEGNKVTVTGTFTGASTATVTVNGIAAVVTGQSFTATDVPLAPGPNTITAVATSPAGATDTKSITVTSLVPTILITSPANGAVINGDSVLVRGTFTAPANSGVQVDGVVAALDGASFVAVVPLVPGANTITATATSPRGASGSASINVTASGLPPDIVATVTPLTGMAPLPVTISVENPTDTDATFMLDTFGQTFGPFGAPAGATVALAITYPEGVFPTTVTVNGGAAQSFVIVVTSIDAMDAMIQALWSQIIGRLAAGDIEGALVYFSPPMRDTYREVLNDIAPSLPGMFASFPPISPTSLADGNAEYFVPIVRNGRTFGYFLYFMRDGDGIWRLHTL